MAIKKNKSLDYYLKLPWSYTVITAIEDGESFFIVRVNELPGVCTDAPTVEEAMTLIKQAIKGAIELYIDNNEEVPEPINPQIYKGKILYRTTGKRHLRLVREATIQNKSLSAVIDECIDRTIK
jgi:predicted RNase H-like HicB family nuclease